MAAIKKSGIAAGLALVLVAGLALADPIGKFELKNQDGKILKSEDLKGQKTLLVISQTACGQCKLELTELSPLYDELKKSGSVFVVLVDQVSERALDIYYKRGYPFPVLLDPEFSLSGLAKVGATPATVILDKNLEIAYTKVGYKAGQGPELAEEFGK